MSDELKPCPCCGETAEIDTRQTFRGIADGRLMEALAIYCTGCTLQITVCYADVPDITTEQVIAMWNTRAQSQDALAADNQLMRDLLRQLWNVSSNGWKTKIDAVLADSKEGE